MHRQISFRGMKISGRRVDAQAVTAARAGDFFPSADGHGMPKQAAEPDRIQRDRVTVPRIIFTGGPRSFAERPHCAERSGVREARRKCKHGHRGAFINTERIGLIPPVEIMGIRANGVIGMLGGLVISEETLGFLVETGGMGIVPYAGEKARHSTIRCRLPMRFKSLPT